MYDQNAVTVDQRVTAYQQMTIEELEEQRQFMIESVAERGTDPLYASEMSIIYSIIRVKMAERKLERANLVMQSMIEQHKEAHPHRSVNPEAARKELEDERRKAERRSGNPFHTSHLTINN